MLSSTEQLPLWLNDSLVYLLLDWSPIWNLLWDYKVNRKDITFLMQLVFLCTTASIQFITSIFRFSLSPQFSICTTFFLILYHDNDICVIHICTTSLYRFKFVGLLLWCHCMSRVFYCRLLCFLTKSILSCSIAYLISDYYYLTHYMCECDEIMYLILY